MTRKPNFYKIMLGLAVIAALFVGTWATTHSPLTSAKNPAPGKAASTNPKMAPNPVPVAPFLDAITSVIELDGDIVDNPAGLPEDWDTINCDGGVALGKTGVLFDGLGNSIFTGGGSKDPELLASWKHKNGSVPDKDELLNAYAAKYTGPTGDDILAFGADRFANDGTAFMGFWFFVNPVFPAADGRFRQGPLATDPLASHAVGDVLVLIEFTQGGAVATAKVFEWVGVGGTESGGTLRDITATAPAGSVLSVSNPSPQSIAGTCSAWQHHPKNGPDGTIQVNAFFEGAINLDAFPALQGACFSSFLAETRSSASVTATLKDFVLGQFDTCPNVEITKTPDDTEICDGTTTTYTYDVNNPTSFTLSGTIVDDNGTPCTSPNNPVGCAADDRDVGASGCPALNGGSPTSISLPPGHTQRTCTATLSVGSHTNIVEVIASFGGFSAQATATATVVVQPNPSMSISTVSCDTTGSIQLTATDANSAGGTLSWTRQPPGGGTKTAFAGNVSSITVTTPGIYEVTSTTSAGCVGTATRTVGLCAP
jgi:hypothetical protein